jgi:hypothetical protein
MVTEHDGSGGGLNLFLEWAGTRGEMNPATAKTYQAAAKSVLSVEADPASVDIRSLDVAAILDRFETLNRTRYTSDSMATYKSRFRQAVAMYLAWLDKEPGWRQAGRSRRAGTQAGATSRSSRKATAAPDVVVDDVPSSANLAGRRLIAYDLPLRPNLLVRLTLPVDLTSADADRVANFVKSLAFANSSDQPPVMRPGAAGLDDESG